MYYGAWIVFAILAYQVSQFETTEGYDPYKILGVPSGTTDCALTPPPSMTSCHFCANHPALISRCLPTRRWKTPFLRTLCRICHPFHHNTLVALCVQKPPSLVLALSIRRRET